MIVDDRYDVIVAGGGPAGIAAAVSASRQKASVALIERYGILGGMLTSGHVQPILGHTAEYTMYHEVVELLNQGHPECKPVKTRNGSEIPVDTEQTKLSLLKFAVENGVQVFLQTPVIDVVMEGNQLRGVLVGTQEGVKPMYAHTIVDATGDGFVAARAGVPFNMGRDQDGRCQPVSIEFTLENVDESTAITCFGGSDPVELPDGTKYADFCHSSNQKGELPENVTIVRLHRTCYQGERQVNATQVNNCNTLTPEGIQVAELTAREQIPVITKFLQKNIPGYADCHVKSSASTLGVRETRRIVGEYILTDEDVEKGSRFEDVVVHKAWFLIDIHNPNGGGQAEKRSQPATPYDIPLRSLIPVNIDGLILAGRCISGTHRAHASYRVMGVALAIGQAAGVAAALCAKQKLQPRTIAYQAVQHALTETGVTLFDE